MMTTVVASPPRRTKITQTFKRDRGPRSLNGALRFALRLFWIASVAFGSLALTAETHAEFFVGAGAVGSPFLDIPINPRAAAMGQAFTAGSADSAALEYNPAGLAGISKREIDFSLIRHIQDTDLQSVNFSGPFLSVESNSTTLNPPRIVLGGQYRAFNAEDEERNSVGAKISDFKIKDQVFQISGSFGLTRSLYGGLSAKYINRKIQDTTANSYAGDIGFLWSPSPRWSWGAAVLNLGPERAFLSEKDPLPTRGRVGGALTLDHVMVTADVSEGRDKVLQPGLGAEWKLNRLVALRAGTFYQDTIEFTGGLGLFFSREGAPTLEPVARSNPSPDKKELKIRETMVSSALYQIAEELTQAYESSTAGGQKPRLAVFPLDNDTTWNNATLTSRLSREFEQINVFQVLSGPYMDTALGKKVGAQQWDEPAAMKAAEALSADYIVLGTVSRYEGGLRIQSRLLQVKNRLSLGQSEKTVPQKWMEATSAQKLGATRPASATNVEFGIDYAIQTAAELGVSHTVMVKILF